MLPHHGQIACRKCFEDNAGPTVKIGNWKLQNDPCHWGSSEPEYLILGFSKGFTQVGELSKGRFEDVPFKGMRPRLGRILNAFEILDDETAINSLFDRKDSPIAFGSLIRCSASRIDKNLSKQKGTEVYGCTGALIPKSFSEIPQVISNCTKQFLQHLPDTVRIIVLLGNGDAYIKGTKSILKKMFASTFKEINPCAVAANGKLWVWASHPSGLNGHFESWIAGIGTSGIKFNHAISAVKNFRGNDA